MKTVGMEVCCYFKPLLSNIPFSGRGFFPKICSFHNRQKSLREVKVFQKVSTHTLLPEFTRVCLKACLAGEVLAIALSQEDSTFHTKALRYGPARTAFHSVPSLALLIRLLLSALATLRAVGMPWLSLPSALPTA